MKQTLTFNDFQEHDRAKDHEQAPDFPVVGTVIPDGTGSAKVIRAKVVSAFWFTENILMKKEIEIDPTIRYKQKRTQPTVLFIVETEPVPARGGPNPRRRGRP